MKRQLIITCILLLMVILAGCSETQSPVVSKPSSTSETKVAVETPTAPPRTPLPAHIRKDADGNLINPEGWPIQEIIPEESKRRTETGKTKSGKTVIFNVLLITPEGRAASEVAVPEDNYYELRISSVRELSGHDGRIFCYEYRGSLFARNSNSNGFASSTSYRLCDYDGDGKYEYKGSSFYKFTIPDWVKSLPGDPDAIDNNANIGERETLEKNRVNSPLQLLTRSP